MQVTIENYNGVARADFNAERITTIFGRNAQGKSSLADAVARCAARETFKTKPEAMQNIKAGFDQAEITLQGESGSIAFTLPVNKIDTSGGASWSISKVAAGLETPAGHGNPFELLHEYLDATPDKDDLAAELETLGILDAGVDRIWGMVLNPASKQPDWPMAHKKFEDQRKAQKGQFQEVTKITWGSKQGGTWLPDGYDRELENESEESLRGALSQRELALEEAVRNEALGEAEREKLIIRADAVQDFKAKLEAVVKEIEQADADLIAIREEADTLPKPDAAETTWPCWNCGKHNAVEGGKGVEPKAIDKKEAEAREKAIEAKREDYRQVKANRDSMIADKRVIEENIAAGEAAKEKLAAAPDGGGVDVEKARNEVERARQRLTAFTTCMRARKLHSDILQSDKLVSLTAPDGLPGKKLGAAIANLNKDLKKLSEVAEWGTVKVSGADGTVSYDGKIYSRRKPSTSEKFRTEVTLQVALANIKGDSMVIVDAIDVLDGAGRSGLYWLLDDAGLDALVTCTVSDKDEAPHLEHFGPSYWIEGGELSPLEIAEEAELEPA